MMSNFDSAFRILSSGDYADQFSGDSDSPTGYFALVEVPTEDEQFDEMVQVAFADSGLDAEEVQAYREALTDERGWYIVTTVSSGLVFPVRYPSEDAARGMFNALDEDYGTWSMEPEEYMEEFGLRQVEGRYPVTLVDDNGKVFGGQDLAGAIEMHYLRTM